MAMTHYSFTPGPTLLHHVLTKSIKATAMSDFFQILTWGQLPPTIARPPVIYHSAHIPTLPTRASVAAISALKPPDDTVFDKFGDRLRANIKLDTVMDMPMNEQLSSSDETSSDRLSDITEEDPVLPDDHPFLQHRTEILLCAFRGLRQHLIQNNPGGFSNQRREAFGDHNSTQNDQQAISSTKRAAQTEVDELAYGESSSGPSFTKRKQDHQPRSPKASGMCLLQTRQGPSHRLPPILSPPHQGPQTTHMAEHRQPQSYCPTCYVFFPGEHGQEYEPHVQARSCLSRPRPEWDGVTNEQGVLITQKETPGAGDESQWYSVWDKVFPGQPRPSTPYVENVFSAEIMHEYWTRFGPGIISRVLSNQGLLNSTVPNEERALAALQLQLVPHILNEITAGIYRTSTSRPDPPSPADLSPGFVTAMNITSGTIGTMANPPPSAAGFEVPRPMFPDWQLTAAGQTHDQSNSIPGQDKCH